MAVSRADQSTNETVRCPTCRASQPWSDICRRCKCDLSLLRHVKEACARTRRECLIALGAGRWPDAVRSAQRGYWLSPDQHSARLLALCHLIGGNWLKAAALAQLADTFT